MSTYEQPFPTSGYNPAGHIVLGDVPGWRPDAHVQQPAYPETIDVVDDPEIPTLVEAGKEGGFITALGQKLPQPFEVAQGSSIPHPQERPTHTVEQEIRTDNFYGMVGQLTKTVGEIDRGLAKETHEALSARYLIETVFKLVGTYADRTFVARENLAQDASESMALFDAGIQKVNAAVARIQSIKPDLFQAQSIRDQAASIHQMQRQDSYNVSVRIHELRSQHDLLRSERERRYKEQVQQRRDEIAAKVARYRALCEDLLPSNHESTFELTPEERKEFVEETVHLTMKDFIAGNYVPGSRAEKEWVRVVHERYFIPKWQKEFKDYCAAEEADIADYCSRAEAEIEAHKRVQEQKLERERASRSALNDAEAAHESILQALQQAEREEQEGRRVVAEQESLMQDILQQAKAMVKLEGVTLDEAIYVLQQAKEQAKKGNIDLEAIDIPLTLSHTALERNKESAENHSSRTSQSDHEEGNARVVGRISRLRSFVLPSRIVEIRDKPNQ